MAARTATLTLTEDSGLAECAFTSTSTADPPSECEVDPESCEPEPQPEKCRVYSSTTFGARIGSAAGADILTFELADTRFCTKETEIEIHKPRTRGRELRRTGIDGGGLASLGMKFKYRGANKPRAISMAAGMAQSWTTGRWDFCVQVPIPLLNKGVGKVLDLVPKPVQFILRSTMKAVARSDFVPTKFKKKLLKVSLSKVIDESSLREANKEALKFLVKETVKTVFHKLEEALLKVITDGYCTKKVWEPEITVAVTKTGKPSSSVSGDPAIFVVLPVES